MKSSTISRLKFALTCIGLLSILMAGCAPADLQPTDTLPASVETPSLIYPGTLPATVETPSLREGVSTTAPTVIGTTTITSPASAWQNTPFGPLTLAEYRVVDAQVDTPNHFEFNQRIPPEVFGLRAAQRDWWLNLEQQAAQANAVLQRFGWKVEVGPVTAPSPRASYLVLFHNGSQEMQLSFMRPIAVSASGASFALVMESLGGKPQDWLLTQDGLAPWDASLHAYVTRPVFVGETMVTAGNENSWETTTVWAGTQTYHIPVSAGSNVESPIKGLGAYQDQWVLELQGQLVVNGIVMNEALGCEEIFAWQLLGGKPFYFCRAGGKVSLVYDGQALGVSYDEVIHYACCEPAAFNAGGNEAMVWFYARRMNQLDIEYDVHEDEE